MANIAVQRIKREFKEVLKSEETSKNQIKVDLVDENFTELMGEIAGPPDTPYEGGRYQLEIKIPETYPFNPPKVRFITKIWHPNISSVTGSDMSGHFKRPVGSCYDPADGAAVSTGPARRSRTRRSTGCSSSKPV
ncbi:Ubiquitin-conjugating enzyme E2 K [Larimichthys crocea]|uniref:Uncharacterized protein n=1 Tax=Larimichthys crocea TaxID=215358 RepID=A0ACD3RUN9_LARCR|nr:Ubiquitin-conjugating enzyme E2 K [Larimichthys crocea]